MQVHEKAEKQSNDCPGRGGAEQVHFRSEIALGDAAEETG
jgi:hypothetical protein